MTIRFEAWDLFFHMHILSWSYNAYNGPETGPKRDQNGAKNLEHQCLILVAKYTNKYSATRLSSIPSPLGCLKSCSSQAMLKVA